MLLLPPDDPRAVAAVAAIQGGDVSALKRLLAEHSGLAKGRVGTRSLLHLAADWPGHFPNGAAVVAALIAAGADPNVRHEGAGAPETPLHWAASSDDVDVLDALIDGGADLELAGASIAGGTALDDAVGYGQWRAARRLVERGAKVHKLWHAAALGLVSRVEEFFSTGASPSPGEVSLAFWQACHGGQLRAAELLLARGADLNWLPPWAKALPLDIALRSGNEALVAWLRGRRARLSVG